MTMTRAKAAPERAGAESSNLASIGALLGDPVRAAILFSLADGSARPASELAHLAGASPQAASAHLAQLVDGGLLGVENQGRNRFFRLACGEVAEMIEALDNWADRRARRVNHDPALCRARLCYDHLAGRLGVAIFDAMAAQRWLVVDASGPSLSAAGREWQARHGFDCEAPPHSRRPLLRLCLDWTERRHHIGGHFGAALARGLFDRGYLRRDRARRVVAITPPGLDFLKRELAIDLTN
jgi:DNA-binding transcriptional ArsR family regulator